MAAAENLLLQLIRQLQPLGRKDLPTAMELQLFKIGNFNWGRLLPPEYLSLVCEGEVGIL